MEKINLKKYAVYILFDPRGMVPVYIGHGRVPVNMSEKSCSNRLYTSVGNPYIPSLKELFKEITPKVEIVAKYETKEKAAEVEIG
jgi:hypothetical protein